MTSNFQDSVVLITGSELNRFGTGFVIHQDRGSTYLLTCAHVVANVGGTNTTIKANDIAATVIASDAENGFDLAVLRVDKQLEIPPLCLCISEQIDCSFITAGYYMYEKLKVMKQVKGVLRNVVRLRSTSLESSCTAWQLEIDGDDCLEHGHSGAPVVNKESGKVLGVISHREGQGQKGLAISVAVLQKIWPGMPESLLASFKIPKVKLVSAKSTSRPLMNFEKEVGAFREIVTGQDTATRLILVHGPTGMGKSRLLDEYRRVACENDIEVLTIPLGPQISVEECLNFIIHRFNIKHFTCYNQFRRAGRPEPLTLVKEKEWQENLTLEFFTDLSNNPHLCLLPIFFDQYEKAAPPFKEWLSHVFLPGIFSHSLLVVVAGQEEIDQKPAWQGYRHFLLTGVSIDWYHRYAADCNVHIEHKLINEFHKILHGEPKLFVDYVNSLLTSEAGGAL